MTRVRIDLNISLDGFASGNECRPNMAAPMISVPMPSKYATA